MLLVRDPRRAAVSLALVSALLLGACGGSGSEESAQSGGGPAISPLPINLADCDSWNEASVEQRLATVGRLHQFSGGPVQGTEGGTGAVLDDDVAYDYFDQYCENEFAGAFKLYKLYGRAAAFGSK